MRRILLIGAARRTLRQRGLEPGIRPANPTEASELVGSGCHIGSKPVELAALGSKTQTTIPSYRRSLGPLVLAEPAGGTRFAFGGPSKSIAMFVPRQILLADDDSTVRNGVAELLSDLGIEVLHAETGREALEIVRSQPIHACLLDLQMPECGGLEALPLIRLARADLPCLVYSGSLTDLLEREALRIGAFAVLRKPVQPQLLRQQICRAVGLTMHG